MTVTKKDVIATAVMIATVAAGTILAQYAWEKYLKAKLIK